MADLSALYPQPPQQQQPQSALSNPAGLMQLALQARAFRAKQALGSAFLSNLNPDGTPNIEGTAAALKDNPDAAPFGQEAVQGLQDAYGKKIENDTKQFGLTQSQNNVARAGFAALTGLAQKGKAKPEDVLGLIPTLVRNGVPPEQANSVKDWLLTGDLNKNLITLNNGLAGAAGAQGLIPGPPGPGGRPQMQSPAAGAYPATAGGMTPIGLPPGEEIPYKGAAEAARVLEHTADTSPLYHSQLENLKQDSRVLGNIGNPGVQTEAALNAVSQRIAGFGITMTPEQMRAAGSFGKIVNQISLNQAGVLGDTDAARGMTLHANPNIEMPQQTREGLIDMLHGNQDAVDVARRTWMQAKKNGAPANSYYDFAQQFGNETLNGKTGAKFDPRVFQFNRMSDSTRQEFLNSMDKEMLGKFEANYQEAIKRGWVPSPKKTNAAQ